MIQQGAAVVFAILILTSVKAQAQRLAFDPPTAREAEIHRQLRREVSFRFQEIPLEEVCESIAERYRIRPMLDTKALDEVGIGTDTPVTTNIDGVSLATALDVMLRRIDPTISWSIEKEMLVISTREAFEENLQTWIYDVTPIVTTVVYPDGYEPDFDSLIELITKTIEPDSWDEVGGPGSIAEFETNEKFALVISTTYKNHRFIDAFIRKLYRFAGRRIPAPSQSLSRSRWRKVTSIQTTPFESRTSGEAEVYNPRNLPMTKPRTTTPLYRVRRQPDPRQMFIPRPSDPNMNSFGF